MTNEELEKKATLYADEHCEDKDEYGDWLSDEEMLKRAFIAGAKEMQKENEQLRKQIDKMKDCDNCKYIHIADCDVCGECDYGYTNWELDE